MPSYFSNDPIIRREFIKRLQWWMQHRGIETASDLARRAFEQDPNDAGATGRDIIAGWLSGKSGPSEYKLKLVAKALECDLENLIPEGALQREYHEKEFRTALIGGKHIRLIVNMIVTPEQHAAVSSILLPKEVQIYETTNKKPVRRRRLHK